MKRMIPVVLAVLLTACAGAVSSSASETPSATASANGHTLTGTFTLHNREEANKTGDSCRGTGGYADIQPGVDVVVRNDAERIIATGSLSYAPRGGQSSTHCQYAFEIKGIPDSPFYTVEVGKRGKLTYSAAELDRDDWKLDLTLGD